MYTKIILTILSGSAILMSGSNLDITPRNKTTVASVAQKYEQQPLKMHNTEDGALQLDVVEPTEAIEPTPPEEIEEELPVSYAVSYPVSYSFNEDIFKKGPVYRVIPVFNKFFVDYSE